MAADRAHLDRDGCLLVTAAVAAPILVRLADQFCAVKAGARLRTSDPALAEVQSVLAPVIAWLLPEARPVRAIWFDKTAEANWMVPWHQDRTIAVRARHEVPGFGPWSVKQGTSHVEPPFALLADMLTVRLHIDDCPADNAPLEVAIGSHQQRIPADAVAAEAARHALHVCLAAAGDLWVYRTPIIHRSAPAARAHRRRVLQMDYCAAALPEPLAWAG